jgi:hypothetical protein
MDPSNPDEPEPIRLGGHAKTQRRQDLIKPLLLLASRLGVRFFYQKCEYVASKVVGFFKDRALKKRRRLAQRVCH